MQKDVWSGDTAHLNLTFGSLLIG